MCRAHPVGDATVCVLLLPFTPWNILVYLLPHLGWVVGPHESGLAWCSSPGLVSRQQRPRTTPTLLSLHRRSFPVEALSSY